MKNILTAPGGIGTETDNSLLHAGYNATQTNSLRQSYLNQTKPKEESTIFKGLSKEEENEIFDICDSKNISLQSKNILANELYEKKLKENKTRQYFFDKSNMSREIAKAAIDTDSKEQANSLNESNKVAELANGVRRFIMKNNPDVDPVQLTKLDDKDIASDFVQDNPQLAVAVNEYLDPDYKGSTEDFLYKVGLPTEDFESILSSYKEPVNSQGSIYHEVTSAARSGEEWNDRLADWLHADTTSLEDTKGSKLGTFLGNAFKSTWNIAADAVGAVLNPIDTANSLIDIVGGLGTLAGFAAEQAFGDGDYSKEALQDYIDKYYPEGSVSRNFFKPEETTAVVGALGDYFKGRYGGIDEIKNTLYQDPAGFLQDFADLFKGGSGIANKISKTSKITKGLEEISNTLNKVNKGRDRVHDTALNTLNKGVDVLTDTSIEDIKNIPSNVREGLKNYADSAKGLIGQLPEEERIKIQNNPYAGKTIQDMIKMRKESGATKTVNQLYDEAVSSYVKNELVPRLEDVIKGVTDEGRVYGDVDKLKLKANNFQSEFENILRNKNIGIDADGNLDFTKTHTINEKSDSINKIYNQLKEVSNRGEDITVDEYRDIRQLIRDEMNNTSKGTDTYDLFKKSIETLNEDAHGQIPELSQLDELFNKNAEKAKKLKEGLVDKKGNIKPEALARETKKTGKTSGLSSQEQLEQLLPGHKEKVDALNMAKNMLSEYEKGNKLPEVLGSTLRGAGHLGGLIASNAVTAIFSGYLGEFVGKKLGKYLLSKRDIDWGDALSNLSEEGMRKMKEINKAIEAGDEIDAATKAKIDEIIRGTQATKAAQKAEAKATKAATKAAAKETRKAEMTQKQLDTFLKKYRKFRGIDEYADIVSPAKSSSPFANQQYEIRKRVNEQVQSQLNKS